MDIKTENLEIASYYLVNPVNSGKAGIPVVLEKVFGREEKAKWAVRDGGDCLNKKGKFEYEPMPSSRTEDFLNRCRFSSTEEALEAWALHQNLLAKTPPEEKINHVTKNKLVQ